MRYSCICPSRSLYLSPSLLSLFSLSSSSLLPLFSLSSSFLLSRPLSLAPHSLTLIFLFTHSCSPHSHAQELLMIQKTEKEMKAREEREREEKQLSKKFSVKERIPTRTSSGIQIKQSNNSNNNDNNNAALPSSSPTQPRPNFSSPPLPPPPPQQQQQSSTLYLNGLTHLSPALLHGSPTISGTATSISTSISTPIFRSISAFHTGGEVQVNPRVTIMPPFSYRCLSLCHSCHHSKFTYTNTQAGSRVSGTVRAGIQCAGTFVTSCGQPYFCKYPN